MSRTKRNSGSSSPIQKYLSFSGSKGQLKYYDKDHVDADEKGNVYLDSLDLIVLDIKSSISGYNENESSGINSNLLDPYSVGKENFVVKTKVNGNFGVFAEGIYKDIKEKLATINAKFTTNVFGLADFGGGYEIVKLELNGSGLSPWIELNNEFDNSDDVYDNIISIKKGSLLTRKAGKTIEVSDAEYKKVLAAIKKDPMYQRPVWFYAPAFSTEELTEELSNLAIEKDEVLQRYFDQSGVAKSEEDNSESAGDEFLNLPVKSEPVIEEADDLPF